MIEGRFIERNGKFFVYQKQREDCDSKTCVDSTKQCWISKFGV